MTMPLPPAGWYPDPSGATGPRYFDGTAWANPPVPHHVPAERRFTIHYGFVVLAIFSLLGTIIPCAFWFIAAGNIEPGVDPAETESAETAASLASFFGVGWLLWGGMWTIIWAAFAVHHTLRGRR